MKIKFRFLNLIMMMLAVAATAACGGGTEGAVAMPADSAVEEEAVPAESADSAENDGFWLAPFDGEVSVSGTVPAEKAESDKREAEREADAANSAELRTKANAETKRAARSYGGKETLYISTYGANGKVWGHVTMNGETGRGTIHDDDENSYSITVKRHGGELYGTDQNGRQYVFRL